MKETKFRIMHTTGFRLGVAVTLTLALATAAILFAPGRSSAESGASSAQPAPPVVTVAPVESRELAQYAELTGRVEAVESVEVRPRVNGYVQEVRFQSGRMVQKGDVLFVIDPRWHKADADRTAAELQRAESRVATAERTDERAQQLLVSKAVSAEEADQRSLALAEARAALASARAANTSAQLDLEYTEVRAPVPGRVSRALVTTGNFVSGASTLLTTVVSIDPVYVYSDLDEPTWLRLQRLAKSDAGANGADVVEMGLRDEAGFPRRGRIESFDNRLDEMSGSIVLRTLFDNHDGTLIPGLFARLRVPVSQREPTILISERAIGTDQGQKYVLVLDVHNKVQYRAIQLGPAIEGKRVVPEGLKTTEEIVVNGLQRVRPGSLVTPEREVAPGAAQPKSASR